MRKGGDEAFFFCHERERNRVETLVLRVWKCTLKYGMMIKSGAGNGCSEFARVNAHGAMREMCAALRAPTIGIAACSRDVSLRAIKK